VKIATVGSATKFDATGSFDPDGTIINYHWDFGDGTVRNTTTPKTSHTYQDDGGWQATLTLTDNEGCSNQRVFTGKATLCNGPGLASFAPILPIRAPRCLGKKPTIVGNSTADTITGTNKDDVIVALRGDDKINARGGNDRVCAGEGNDVVHGGSGNDIISGGPGNDKLYGDGGKDKAYGGPGKNTVRP
jgi:Ca2+-binding RTX toxin-like protein